MKQTSIISWILWLLLVSVGWSKTEQLEALNICLGGCARCEQSDLLTCTIPECIHSFVNDGNHSCYLNPVLNLHEGEISFNISNTPKEAEDNKWEGGQQVSSCVYQGKQSKYFNAYGLYSQDVTLNRIFNLEQISQFVRFQFTLIRSGWDDKDQILITLTGEENYSRQFLIKTGKAKPTKKIHCGKDKTPLSVETFGMSLTNSFTFFKAVEVSIKASTNSKALWGMANVAFLYGCDQLVMADESQECNSCRALTYPLYDNSMNLVGCALCPIECVICIDNNTCKMCSSPFDLIQGKCMPKSIYAPVEMDFGANKQMECSSMILPPIYSIPDNKQAFREITFINPNRKKYDSFTLLLRLYMDPLDWFRFTEDQIELVVNGQVAYMFQNSSNQTITCPAVDTALTYENFILLDQAASKDQKGVQQITIRRKMGSFVGMSSMHVMFSSSKTNTNNSEFATFQVSEKENDPVSFADLFFPFFLKSSYLLRNGFQITNISPNALDQLIEQEEEEEEQEDNSTALVLNSEQSLSTAGQFPLVIASAINNYSPQQALESYEENFASYSLSAIPFLGHSADGLLIKISAGIDGLMSQSLKVCALLSAEDSKKPLTTGTVQAHPTFLILPVSLNESFIDGSISLLHGCSSLVPRLLQSIKNEQLNYLFVTRFDRMPDSQKKDVMGLSNLFFFLFVVVMLGWFLSTLLGMSVIFEEAVICLQKCFLFVYLYSSYSPMTFRATIGGARRIENFNYFGDYEAKSIQEAILGNVVQDHPIKFMQFKIDANFTRAFYPIALLNIFYFFWFGLVILLKLTIRKKLPSSTVGDVIRNIIDGIGSRLIHSVDQIWRTQFLAICWLAFSQFSTFAYPIGYNGSQALNEIYCIIILVASLAWPIIVSLYVARRYTHLKKAHQDSKFLYHVQDIYWGRYDQAKPSIHQRIVYPFILKPLKILVFAALIVTETESALPVTLGIMTLCVLDTVYVAVSRIYTDSKLLIMHITENLFTLAMCLCFIIAIAMSESATSLAYGQIGYATMSFAFLSVVNSLVRAFYIASRKVVEIVLGKQANRILSSGRPRASLTERDVFSERGSVISSESDVQGPNQHSSQELPASEPANVT